MGLDRCACARAGAGARESQRASGREGNAGEDSGDRGIDEEGKGVFLSLGESGNYNLINSGHFLSYQLLA